MMAAVPSACDCPLLLGVRVCEREFFIDNLLVRTHLITEKNFVDRPCAMRRMAPATSACDCALLWGGGVCPVLRCGMSATSWMQGARSANPHDYVPDAGHPASGFAVWDVRYVERTCNTYVSQGQILALARAVLGAPATAPCLYRLVLRFGL